MFLLSKNPAFKIPVDVPPAPQKRSVTKSKSSSGSSCSWLKRVENGVPFCSIKLDDSVVIFTRLFVRRACFGGRCKTRVAQLCDED